MTLTGGGTERAFCSTEIQFAKQGKIYLGLFDSTGDCYVGLLDRLPDMAAEAAVQAVVEALARLGVAARVRLVRVKAFEVTATKQRRVERRMEAR